MNQSLKTFKEEYRDLLVNFLWRQWSALGVAGQASGEDVWSIDPEALLLFTCTLGRYEPRLFDEVLDWLQENGRFINVMRLKRILRTEPFAGERALAAWQKATGSGGPFALECRLRAADGAYKWWLIRGVPLKDVAGNVLNWYCTCTDIHEFKEAQVQLKDQAALLDKARDAIVVLDLESRILYWNAGAERIYGWTSEGSLGRSFVGFTVHDTAAYQKAMDATLADGEWFGELEQRTKDGRGIVVEAGVVCCAASRERPSPSWSSTPMSHSVAPSRHSCARPSVWRR